MLMPTLALATWITGLLAVFFLVTCLLLMLIILIQRPQGGGLAGAFGSGAGSGQTAFGARTGDALTVATIGIFVLYLLTAVGLNYAFRPSDIAPHGAAVSSPGAPVTEPLTPGAGTPAPAGAPPAGSVPAPGGTAEPSGTAGEGTPGGDAPAAEPAPAVPPAEGAGGTPPAEPPASGEAPGAPK